MLDGILINTSVAAESVQVGLEPLWPSIVVESDENLNLPSNREDMLGKIETNRAYTRNQSSSSTVTTATDAHDEFLDVFEEHEDADGTIRFEDLPEDATSVIFSFAYNSSSVHAGFQQRKTFFDNVFYLSKAIHQSATYFLKNRIKHAGSRDVPVMCKYGASPRSINFQIASKIDMIVFLHILKTCNLSVLETLIIRTNEILLPEDERLKSKAARESRSMRPEEFENADSLSSESFQYSVAKTLRMKAPSLARLEFGSIAAKLFTYVPMSCSKMLEEISLRGYHSYKSWQDSEHVFSKMHRLKKLSMEYGMVDCISSESLEELHVANNFKIQSIRCPALKKLSINVKIDSLLLDANDLFPASLEDVSLTLNHAGFDCVQCTRILRQICDRLRDLRHLKKLRLRGCGFHRSLNVIIHSDTLEEIDMAMASKYIHVTKCKCPLLKIFRYSCQLECSETLDVFSEERIFKIEGIASHVLRPVEAFTSADFDLPIYAFQNATHTFQVKERGFHGLIVPDTCIVQIDALYNIDSTSTMESSFELNEISVNSFGGSLIADSHPTIHALQIHRGDM